MDARGSSNSSWRQPAAFSSGVVGGKMGVKAGYGGGSWNKEQQPGRKEGQDYSILAF